MRILSPVLLAALVLVTTPVFAVGQSDEIESFALNNVRFVLYHELGHMLVDQLHLPVLGREEDAVDNIATYRLLSEETDEGDQTLIDAANGWLLSDANSGDETDDSAFYDQHSLDLQRAYQIVCLMVGDDPDEFGSVADDMEIDEERQQSCADDYQQVETSLEALLGPYEGSGEKIDVAYDSATPEFADAAALLQKSNMLEAAAAELSDSFKLPNPTAIRASICGEANAFYDPETLEVTICYELLEDYIQMAKADAETPEN